MQAICQLGDSRETSLTREGAGCLSQAERCRVVIAAMGGKRGDDHSLVDFLHTFPPHSPTGGEYKSQALATSRRTGSLVDIHWDREPEGCRDAMDSFQRKGDPVHAPPEMPMHCIQLWSSQTDVVSGAVLQEGSGIPGWGWLMVTEEWRKPHLFDFPLFSLYFPLLVVFSFLYCA